MKECRVHFVGIGGIGVSALARWYKGEGWDVTGSDLEASEITQKLMEEGIPVAIGQHHAENIMPGTHLLVYSAAASKNHEISAAKRRHIKTKSYSEALGELTKNHLTIAISGSHGKSTTTALIALILVEAGFDPTVIIGTKLKEFADPERWRDVWLAPYHNLGTTAGFFSERALGSNFRKGRTPILIIEADEWNGSFWNYVPTIAVVTNIDKEHLDFYKTHKKVLAAFRKFLLKGVPGGRIVINADDPGAYAVASELKKKHKKRFRGRVHYFSLTSPEAAFIRPMLRLTGQHNASNAMAAYTVASLFNIPIEITEKVLTSFEGAWRRFEKIGTINGAPVIADYAHHPQEISSTITGAKQCFPSKKIIAVFQPHHYERTRDLFKEFQTAFIGADKIGLLDIYEVAGRERSRRNANIHSFHLARSISKHGQDAYYLPYASQLREFLQAEADPNHVILMMGAGSIWKLSKELLQ